MTLLVHLWGREWCGVIYLFIYLFIEVLLHTKWHYCSHIKKYIKKSNRKFSKLDLCEGGSFSPTSFNSDIELSVFSPFRVLYLFVALSKATYAENSHIVLKFKFLKNEIIKYPVSCILYLFDIKKRSCFNLLCVLICCLER